MRCIKSRFTVYGKRSLTDSKSYAAGLHRVPTLSEHLTVSVALDVHLHKENGRPASEAIDLTQTANENCPSLIVEDDNTSPALHLLLLSECAFPFRLMFQWVLSMSTNADGSGGGARNQRWHTEALLRGNLSCDLPLALL